MKLVSHTGIQTHFKVPSTATSPGPSHTWFRIHGTPHGHLHVHLHGHLHLQLHRHPHGHSHRDLHMHLLWLLDGTFKWWIACQCMFFL